jgi:hypothetical protein
MKDAKSLTRSLLTILALIEGCVSKTICANGNESFRPVLEAAAACRVRVRQVVVGTDIKMPASISASHGIMNWTYRWSDTEFKDGQVVLGHFILKPESSAGAVEKVEVKRND